MNGIMVIVKYYILPLRIILNETKTTNIEYFFAVRFSAVRCGTGCGESFVTTAAAVYAM